MPSKKKLSQPYWLADLDCRALASLTLTGLPWQQKNRPWGVEINKNSKAIHKFGSKFRWNPSKLDRFGWCWSSKPPLHGPSNLAEALWVQFHWFLTTQSSDIIEWDLCTISLPIHRWFKNDLPMTFMMIVHSELASKGRYFEAVLIAAAGFHIFWGPGIPGIPGALAQ